MTTETMTIEDLADLLHCKVKSLHCRINVKPESMPPPVRIVGHKKPLWLRATVMEWLKQHEVVQ